MNREDLEHVIGAAAEILKDEEFVVVGSQAILGPFPDAPASLLRSTEVDIFPRHRPDDAIEIDGSLGDGSMFHETFGYYGHGVGPETAKAPHGWEERLIPIDIPRRGKSPGSVRTYFLEPHDLVLAKCVAGRDRDWDFARDALEAGLVEEETLRSRSLDLPVSDEVRGKILRMLRG
ncbi:MAG: hypothetical protein IPK93_03315 [Solirubrobacterales bacterium]|nr:hypothetical protein [Solirubrobacterales bacterium]